MLVVANGGALQSHTRKKIKLTCTCVLNVKVMSIYATATGVIVHRKIVLADLVLFFFAFVTVAINERCTCALFQVQQLTAFSSIFT